MASELTPREAEVFYQVPECWARPMDIGGRDGSDHSAVLKRLVRKGYVEKRRRNTWMNMLGSSRGSYEYRRVRAHGKTPAEKASE